MSNVGRWGDYILAPKYLATERLLTLYNNPPEIRIGAQDAFRYCIKLELEARGVSLEYKPRSLCGMSEPILLNKSVIEAVCKTHGIDPLFVVLNTAFDF